MIMLLPYASFLMIPFPSRSKTSGLLHAQAPRTASSECSTASSGWTTTTDGGGRSVREEHHRISRPRIRKVVVFFMMASSPL